MSIYGTRCGQLVDVQHEAYLIEKLGFDEWLKQYPRCNRCINLLKKDGVDYYDGPAPA